ncbi:MAG: hypothetical protein K0V04_02465 [Deltaproteobacteria bacterium]|nr:hypothetical protein [Deltaproteobacteria bacterium]
MRRNPLRATTWMLCLLTGVTAQACGDDGGSGANDTSGTAGSDTGGQATGADSTAGMADETGTTAAPPAVTFWDDVAPILYDSCVTCHRDGGIGPFALDSYEQAEMWSTAIAAAVQSRSMPPWLVTDDGTCGDFHDSRWLPQPLVDTIVAWDADGSPEGEPRDDLSLPPPETLEDATAVGTPNFLPEIQGGELAEFDEYRCFLVDPQLPSDQFLTGYDVAPGNAAIVHHVLVMPVDPTEPVGGGQTNADVMADLDAQSPDREGWPCFGEAGNGVDISGIPVAWAPGQGIVEFPEGTGLRISAQEQLVIQVHYNLVDPESRGQTDQTDVLLRLEDSVDREGVMLLPDPFLDSIFGGAPIELPPGEPSVDYTWELPVSDLLGGSGLDSVDLFGVFPHMHEFGRAMSMEIDGPGGPECAADVQHWDFNWQLQYFYEQPRTLTLDDVLRVTCNFDTTSVTEPVTPGWGTNNEMCLMGLYLVP